MLEVKRFTMARLSQIHITTSKYITKHPTKSKSSIEMASEGHERSCFFLRSSQKVQRSYCHWSICNCNLFFSNSSNSDNSKQIFSKIAFLSSKTTVSRKVVAKASIFHVLARIHVVAFFPHKYLLCSFYNHIVFFFVFFFFPPINMLCRFPTLG